MRIRRYVVAGLLAGTLLVLAGRPAFAEDPGKKFGKELVECVEKALKDNKSSIAKKDYKPFENALDDCRKATSIITPAVPEMIWGAVAFAVVAFVLIKFAFPGVRKGLAARQEKIRNDLESAERARTEAEQERAKYEDQLALARQEANRIVEEARVAAEGVRQEVTARADTEAADIRSRAQADARLAADNAMRDLQQRVGDLSIELAEKIVGRNLDRDTQRALVESFISSVDSAQGAN
jgi:F-type H+-transporting ATPase subunit b